MTRLSGLRIFISIALSGALLTLYQHLIWANVLPSSGGRTMWEGNRVRAEDYAFGTGGRHSVVLVGSSLINNIYANQHSGWKNTANLAMVGGASQTGLEVLIRSNGPPGVAVVELNSTIGRRVDPTVVDGIFGYGLFNVRKNYSMLQTQYRPVAVLLRIRELSAPRLFTRWFQSGTHATVTQGEDPLAKLREREYELSADDALMRQRSANRLTPGKMQPLSAKERTIIVDEAKVIQSQVWSSPRKVDRF